MTRLNNITARRSTGLYVAMVMACGFITFHALPDAWPFPVWLTTMEAVQAAVGRILGAPIFTHHAD